MACKDCQQKDGEIAPAVHSWTALPLIDVNNIPDDIDLICGSDKEMKSWRLPLSLVLEEVTMRITTLEKEVESLRKELGNGK